MAQLPTKECIIHGANKADICIIFASLHGLYINDVYKICDYTSRQVTQLELVNKWK